MGISDREYYRDETRGSGWLSGETPACIIIIGINVAVFVLQKIMPPDSVETLLWAKSSLIFHDLQVWRLLTATFVHDGPWHIVMNMVLLYIVGQEMESFYGTRNFTALYIASAIFSTFCWAVVDVFDPNGHGRPMVGASGAVMAVVVLYTLYYPRREVVFMFILRVEMRLLLALYLAYNIIMFLVPNDSSRTAYSAHLGGAAFGYLFWVGDLRLSRLEKLFKRKPRLRIVPAEPRESSATTRPSMGPSWSPGGTAATTRPAPTAVIPEELFDEKVDEILVKIAREGRGALTDEDNRVLEEASRRAQNRRSERI